MVWWRPHGWAGGLRTPSVMLSLMSCYLACHCGLYIHALCMFHFSISCALFLALDALGLTSNQRARWPPLFCGVGKGTVVEKEPRPFRPGSVPPVSLMSSCFVERGISHLGLRMKAFSGFRIAAGWRGKGFSPN